jgi:hypothetical protein
MTPAQLIIFRAAVQAEPALAAARAAGDQGAIVAYYNALGTGTIWRPNITNSELNTAIIWSEFSTLSVALQNTYKALVSVPLIDATNSNIRGGFTTVFGPSTTSRANLTALAQRIPTRFEALFTTAQVCAVYGQLVIENDTGV